MGQSFGEMLSWVPKSRHLGDSLSRAHDYARAQGHEEIGLEHMLLALTSDPDALAVLEACEIDCDMVNSDASGLLAGLEEGDADAPDVSSALAKILEYAVAAARQSKRREVNGAIVIAAIVGEGKNPAAKVLLHHGLTFEAAIKALQSATVKARLQDQTEAPAPAPHVGSQSVVSADAEYETVGKHPNGYAPAERRAEPSGTSSTEDILATARERVSQRSLAHGDHRVETPTSPYEPSSTEPTGDAVGESADADSADAGEPPAHASGSVYIGSNTVDEELDGYAASAQSDKSTSLPPSPQRSAWAPVPTPPPAEGGQARPRTMPPPPPVPPPPGGDPAPPRQPPRNASAPWSPPPPASRDVPGPASRAPADAHFESTRTDVRDQVEFAPGELHENIPRRMRVGVTETIEVRIARSGIAGVGSGMAGRGSPQRHDVVVTRAMSVRLRSPDGGFYVETVSPETQWIDNAIGLYGSDYAKWSFDITPRSSGRHQLQLIVAARTIDGNGLTAETALPDQVFDVRIRANYGKSALKWAGWISAALAGGVLARFGEGIYAIAVPAVRMFTGS